MLSAWPFFVSKVMLRKGQAQVRTKAGGGDPIKDRLFIGTLGIDCIEYSRRCVDSVNTDVEAVKFCYMDNGSTEDSLNIIRNWNIKNSDITEFEVVENGYNAGVGIGWNMLIKKALEWGATKILICNNDIAFGPHTLNGLCSAYDQLRASIPETVMVTAANRTKNPEELAGIAQEWNFHEHPDFSCYMITPETIERLGLLSEAYVPAYFEDNDYHHRILLSGYKAWGTDWAPYSHVASRTRYAHPNLVTHEVFRRNRQQFYDTFHVTGPDQEIEDQRREAFYKANPDAEPHQPWTVVLEWALENM